MPSHLQRQFDRFRAIVVPFLVAALWISSPAASAAQTPTQPRASTGALYRIAGTVVNAITEEPLRRATVAALTEADSHTVASVESDNSGHFALEGLPAGKYQLTAAKRGFRTAFYDEHEEFSSAIVTGADQETDKLVFRLTPGAILRGVVTADGGDPVEGARVLLFRKPSSQKINDRILPAGSTETDDTGAYEFGNLAAGNYLLAASATPWYALNRSPRRMSSGSSTESEANTTLDVAYSITFFDGTTNEDAASPITLAGGSRAEANLVLHAVPALHITVPTSGSRETGPMHPPSTLQPTLFGTLLAPVGASIPSNRQDGMEEFSGIAPGSYEMKQNDPPRILDLDATASQQIDPKLSTPMIAVSVALRSVTGSTFEQQVVLVLQSLKNPETFVWMQPSPTAEGLRTATVCPGDWRLWAQNPGKSWQILSIETEGKSHPGNLVTVRNRPLSLVANLSEGATLIEGLARKDGKGMAGAMVVLVPQLRPGLSDEDTAVIETLSRRDQSDSDGSFALHDAVPGAYTVVAIEDGWDLDWMRPAVIARYLSKGISITITGQSGQLVRLPEPVPVQQR